MASKLRIIALAGLASLMVSLAGPAAIAADGPAPSSLIERETVQAKLSPAGEVGTTRLYSHIVIEGDGTYTIADPASTRGLRNLEGFQRPSISSDAANWTVRVNGSASRRTVATFDKDLPVSIEASYELDGEPIDPKDLVGRDGALTVVYQVRNISGAPTEIEYKDSKGNRNTETVDVVIPLAGSLTMTLPPGFRDVDAHGGVAVGDGRGNTKLSFTTVLFEPLGAVEQELRYTAQVTDAVVPPVTLQVVPVTADQSPLSTGAKSFGDAASSLYELAQGSAEIDQSVIRLAGGAGQVLDGLVKLADGAGELNAGLGDAASGSAELAAGLGQADAGGSQLATGLGELRSGAGTLSNGLGTARSGGSELSGGLFQLRDGAVRLANGLGDASSGGQQLAAGARSAQAGAGRAARGASDIEAGMRQLEAGLISLADDDDKLPALIDGINAYRAQALGGIGAALGTPGSTFTDPDGTTQPSARTIVASLRGQLPSSEGLPGAVDGLGQVSEGLTTGANEAAASGAQLATLGEDQIDTVNGVRQGLGCTDTPVPPDLETVCAPLDGLVAPAGTNPVTLNNTVAAGDRLAGNAAVLLRAAGTLDFIASRLGQGTDSPGALAALAGLEAILGNVQGSVSSGGAADRGLDQLVAGVNTVRDGVRTDAAGNAGLIAGFQGELAGGLRTLAGNDGLGRLAAGAGTLSGGLGQLEDGGRQLRDGTGAAADGGARLADGLGQLDDGGKQLADGAGRAADGSSELASGLGQLSDGGRRLADGLGSAEDGSGQIADGLGLAKLGQERVADGAQELSDRGTSKLASGVDDGYAGQNRNVAMIRALDERSQADGMPYGAPDGAVGSAVYQFELAGADGSGRENATRILLALGAFAALGVVAGLRRRALGVA